jgi:hypothetical protein
MHGCHFRAVCVKYAVTDETSRAESNFSERAERSAFPGAVAAWAARRVQRRTVTSPGLIVQQFRHGIASLRHVPRKLCPYKQPLLFYFFQILALECYRFDARTPDSLGHGP